MSVVSWRDAAATLAALFFAAGGCSGSIGNAGGADDDTPGGGSETGGNGKPPGAGGNIGTVPAECPPKGQIAAAPAPLRRLTREEYNNTIRDLLGEQTRPADAFPPEVAVHGFTNNVLTQGVTFTLADDYFKAAEKLAAGAMARLDRLAPCDVAASGEDGCARTFIRDFGRRAYRRPLSDDEVTGLVGTYQKGRMNADHKNGLRLVLTRMLVSPHFLYRPELGDGEVVADGVRALSPYETATRLSYLLWGTMPDEPLFEAAAAGALTSEDDIAAQVSRLLADERAKPAIRRFYSGWLMLDSLTRAEKDETLYPGWKSMVPAMTEEVTRLVDEVVWSDGGALADLFTSDYSFMNRDLAAFVGISGADAMGSGFERVALAPGDAPGPAWRAGVLTTAGMLAAHAKPAESSPILRGRFVAEQILCLHVPLPPPDVPPAPAAEGADLTTRERFEVHSESACASCHKFLDPLGFAFENFDAVGRFRDSEKGKPIDASGELIGTDVDGRFDNGIEMSARIARSQQMRSCVALQFLRFGLGRDESDSDERTLAQLSCGVKDDAASLLDVIEAFTRSDAFRYLAAQEGGAP